MYQTFLGLGTNLGEKIENLSRACKLLEDSGKILKSSSVYLTAAWGKTDQPDFYNQVVLMQTSLEVNIFFKKIQEIEINMGRERQEKWGQRIIDIDVLFFEGFIISEPTLQIPHPGIAYRRFVLEPLHEIAPEFIHPQLNKTIDELLNITSDKLLVKKLKVV